jgi:hypothetical protein
MERGGIFVDGGKPQGFNITGTVEKGLQRGSLPPPERLRVYALQRFDAQARKQVAPWPCSRMASIRSSRQSGIRRSEGLRIKKTLVSMAHRGFF